MGETAKEKAARKRIQGEAQPIDLEPFGVLEEEVDPDADVKELLDTAELAEEVVVETEQPKPKRSKKAPVKPTKNAKQGKK